MDLLFNYISFSYTPMMGLFISGSVFVSFYIAVS